MVRDAHDAVTDEPELAPRMLHQPADSPPPAGHVGETSPLVRFRRVWSDRQNATNRSLRRWAGRITGRSDRRLLLALASATEAMAAHCDLLVDRLTTQEAVTADLASTFGQEITKLRAQVIQLRRSLAALNEAES
jgi:hypothetical protein